MKIKNVNSIPSVLKDYINYRKKIKNPEDLFVRNDFIFSKDEFISNDYCLAEIILLLTSLSKKAGVYMMKICDLNSDIQDLWADTLCKYI